MNGRKRSKSDSVLFCLLPLFDLTLMRFHYIARGYFCSHSIQWITTGTTASNRIWCAWDRSKIIFIPSVPIPSSSLSPSSLLSLSFSVVHMFRASNFIVEASDSKTDHMLSYNTKTLFYPFVRLLYSHFLFSLSFDRPRSVLWPTLFHSE